MSELKKLDLQTMNWREIFDTIEGNIESLYRLLLSRSLECYVEQYEGNQLIYNLEHEVNGDTTLLIFRNNTYIGGKEGSGEYLVTEENSIMFSEPLEDDESLTVWFLCADSLANLSAIYVEKIKEMYDSLDSLNIDTIKLQDGTVALRDYMNEIGGQIIASANKAEAAKEYAEALVGEDEIDRDQIAVEVRAARGGYNLLGERMNRMPLKFGSKLEFLAEPYLKEGDFVLVYEENKVTAYEVYDSSEREDKVELQNGKVAIILYSSDEHELVGTEESPVEILTIKDGMYWLIGNYILAPISNDGVTSGLPLHKFTKEADGEEQIVVILGDKIISYKNEDKLCDESLVDFICRINEEVTKLSDRVRLIEEAIGNINSSNVEETRDTNLNRGDSVDGESGS